MKKLIAILIILVLAISAILVGYNLGRNNAIRSAQLVNVTENGYEISFGDEVHSYK